MDAAQERIAIPNPAGEKLIGNLHDTGSEELVILCHGLGSSKDVGLLVGLAKSLSEAGLSVFRFDFSGNGESEGEFQFGNYSKEIEDLHAVVLHWLQKGRIVKAIVGHSKGGSTVLLYASQFKEVHTIVNASGRLDLKDGLSTILGADFLQRLEDGPLDVKSGVAPRTSVGDGIAGSKRGPGGPWPQPYLELLQRKHSIPSMMLNTIRGKTKGKDPFSHKGMLKLLVLFQHYGYSTGKVVFYVTKESLMERLSTDLIKAVQTIPKDIRVMSVHGSKDEVVSVDNAYECDKIIANHTLRIVDGADHIYSQHERDFEEIVKKFILDDAACKS